MPTNLIVMKPSMFSKSSKLGVTKSWVTNNHWILHKSLIADVLPWLTQQTALDWLAQFSSVGLPMNALINQDATVANLLTKWKDEGTMYRAPRPYPGTYVRKVNSRGSRATVYTVPKELRVSYNLEHRRPPNLEHRRPPKFCVGSMYYKLFKSQITHMIYVKGNMPPPVDIYDTYVDISLCNKDLTFVLRGFSGQDMKDLERVS
jgi:hypothetical protein